MALSRFFIYSNLFIALCAVLMVNQTCHLLLHETPDYYFMAFVFFSTICSYNFHWYLSSPTVLSSPRIEWQHRYHWLHLVLFIIGLTGSAFSFIYLSGHWFWLLLSAVITFLYSAPKIPNKYFRALRKIALGKTIFLALVWMYVTTILPVMISDKPWQTGFSLFALSRFFLVYSICILFDYRDREDDKIKGIRSLITLLDEKGIRNLFIFSILIFIVSTTGLLFYNYSILSVSILLLPGIIVAALYNYARKNFSDWLYYFVLDGLMALSAFLMLVIQI
ncbi:MAG TPA: UbiA family prenyltransferase [Chitinophagaceae bacterium]